MNDQPTSPPPAPPPGEPPYSPPPPQPTYVAPPAYVPPQPQAAPAYSPPPPPHYGAPLGGYAAPIIPGAPGAAPADYKTAGTFLLIGGITTAICSGLLSVGLLIFFCMGLCWVPFLLLAIWSIVVGARAAGGTRVREIRLANAFGLVAAFFSGDIVGLVFQILALVWLSKEDVSRWVEQPG